MIMSVALLGCLVLGALAVFQALLVAGRPLGRFAWGGQHVVLPPGLRVGSAISIVLYGVFAVLMLGAADALDVLPERFVGVAIWVLTGYFTLGIGLNAISRSRSERLVMTPVVMVLAVVCLVLALQA